MLCLANSLGAAGGKLTFANEKFAHQAFPFVDFLLEFLRRVFALDVHLLKLLVERTEIISRRADAALHGNLLAEF